MRYRDKLKHLSVYAVIGGSTTALYYGLLIWLYKHQHLSLMLATSIAYMIFIASNFFAHRTITFRSNRALGQNFVRYLMLLSFNYGLTLLLIWWVHEVLQASLNLAFIVSVGVTTVIGYVASKLWVY